jgi:hypothetical protein
MVVKISSKRTVERKSRDFGEHVLLHKTSDGLAMEQHSIPKVMKALIKTDPIESYKLVDLPVPVPGEGQTLIKIGMLPT